MTKQAVARPSLGLVVEAVVLAAALATMVGGALVYLTTRAGYLARRRLHLRTRRDDLVAYRLVSADCRPAVVLVPAYREERRIIRQALLSAALQEYPDLRVVLLIDDPPDPGTAEESELLAAARALPGEVEIELEEPRAWVREALARLDVEEMPLQALAEAIVSAYEWSARWLDEKGEAEHVRDHSDRFFVDAVLRERARRLRASAASVAAAVPDRETLRTHAQVLAGQFEAQLASFERKLYTGLSHEPNKAMNLNAYLSLLGRRVNDLRRVDGAPPTVADRTALAVPAADYVATLDADSILLPYYVTRLVGVLEAPDHERVAIAQTPYSSIPGASSRLERVAGATTDLQYVIHQGFTRHEATFWVGANALIRMRALDDIATSAVEGDVLVHRYVHDRTVIEDTESSVDLAAAGWTLVNYPERLSYSATPPDFGSLTVQRRRWANGGLIILPKCLRYLASGPRRTRRLIEGFLRVHYLGSIAASNLAFLILLLCPFDQRLGPIWLPLLGVPYLLLYARDLKLCGHRRRDVVDVAALNLILLPVNLGGVAKSIQQVVLRRKTPFGRTPKIATRTPTPLPYVLGIYGLLILNLAIVAFDTTDARWWHAGFSSATLALAGYGVLRLLGLRHITNDIARAPATAANRGTA